MGPVIMTQVLRTAVRNAAIFALAALPIGIGLGAILSAPIEFWTWSLREKGETFLYVWLGAIGPFGFGFIAHHVGMLLIARARPNFGPRAQVLVPAPLLFSWFLIPGVSLDPSPFEAPARALAPLVVATFVYCLWARPLGESSESMGP